MSAPGSTAPCRPTSPPRPRRAASTSDQWIGDGWAILSRTRRTSRRLHHRASYMAGSSRVRQAQLQDLGLSVDPVTTKRGSKDIEETQGARRHLPDDRRPGARGREGSTTCPRTARHTARRPHGRGQRECARCSSSSTRGQAEADVSDAHRRPLRRGAPGVLDSMPAHGEAQGGDAGELEAGRRRDHRARWSPTTRPRRSTRRLKVPMPLPPVRIEVGRVSSPQGLSPPGAPR